MRLSPAVQRMAIAAGLGIGTAGLLAGVLLLGPLVSTIVLAVVFALVWPLAAVIKLLSDEAPYQSPFLIAACAAGGVLCLPGLVRLLGWGAAGLSVAMLTALLFVGLDFVLPSTRRERRANRRGRDRRFFRRRKPEYGGLILLTRTQEIEDEKLIASLQCPLSIEELCGVWSETTRTLAAGAGSRDRQAVAEVRRICLDEFERRNPEGFQRWLEAGAPANPGTYLLPKPGE
jgi:hypothetical protein